MFGLAIAAGLVPILWAWCTFHVCTLVYERMTVGLTPGDYRFNDAGKMASGGAFLAYMLGLPIVLMWVAIWLTRAQRKRRHGWKVPLLLIVLVVVFGTVGWFVGLAGLGMTIWNE